MGWKVWLTAELSRPLTGQVPFNLTIVQMMQSRRVCCYSDIMQQTNMPEVLWFCLFGAATTVLASNIQSVTQIPPHLTTKLVNLRRCP
uniref:Putative secreted protein n=1 Tax=Ixodes ricinus TaxID=34613 RepID=A0A6B0TZP4_IXORI